MQDDRNEEYDRAYSAAEKTVEIATLRRHIRLLKQCIIKEDPSPEKFKEAIKSVKEFRKKFPLAYTIKG